jgi:type III pantothenate kinase|uniref:Type III pantothenate kinase n=1 Tax=candidate division WOR-3 bacterium TaxID=2052148 RepID=A0A7V5XZG4_UNCW3
MNSLACDIGNSFVKFGFFKDNNLIIVMSVAIKDLKKNKSYFFFRDKIKRVAIASVVSEAKDYLLKEFQKIKGIEVYSLSDLPLDLDISLYEKNKLGEDRIACGYYVYKFYKKNGIVVDLGSATTISCVRKDGVFLGGLILPGIFTSYYFLAKIKEIMKENFIFHKEINYLARSPREGVSEGIKFFVFEGLNYLLKRYRKSLGKDFKVFLTGGLSFLFYRHLKGIDYFEPYLSLKGLNLLLNNI